ncbi:MAG: hypothetical protein HZB76_07475 [Chlamydiae bacterium]|nr:hypothetical protein [Chlamydiota bacterium]
MSQLSIPSASSLIFNSSSSIFAKIETDKNEDNRSKKYEVAISRIQRISHFIALIGPIISMSALYGIGFLYGVPSAIIGTCIPAVIISTCLLIATISIFLYFDQKRTEIQILANVKNKNI